MGKLIASSGTLNGLIKLISDYWGGATIKIDGEDVHNLKGRVLGYRVIKKAGCYRFERD